MVTSVDDGVRGAGCGVRGAGCGARPHSVPYTRIMPVDVDAAVVANRRLPGDYNVIALDAAAIAGSARPGQFVMIKTSRGLDPLLRRPFSIFELLRDGNG